MSLLSVAAAPPQTLLAITAENPLCFETAGQVVTVLHRIDAHYAAAQDVAAFARTAVTQFAATRASQVISVSVREGALREEFAVDAEILSFVQDGKNYTLALGDLQDGRAQVTFINTIMQRLSWLQAVMQMLATTDMLGTSEALGKHMHGLSAQLKQVQRLGTKMEELSRKITQAEKKGEPLPAKELQGLLRQIEKMAGPAAPAEVRRVAQLMLKDVRLLQDLPVFKQTPALRVVVRHDAPQKTENRFKAPLRLVAKTEARQALRSAPVTRTQTAPPRSTVLHLPHLPARLQTQHVRPATRTDTAPPRQPVHTFRFHGNSVSLPAPRLPVMHASVTPAVRISQATVPARHFTSAQVIRLVDVLQRRTETKTHSSTLPEPKTVPTATQQASRASVQSSPTAAPPTSQAGHVPQHVSHPSLQQSSQTQAVSPATGQHRILFAESKVMPPENGPTMPVQAAPAAPSPAASAATPAPATLSIATAATAAAPSAQRPVAAPPPVVSKADTSGVPSAIGQTSTALPAIQDSAKPLAVSVPLVPRAQENHQPILPRPEEAPEKKPVTQQYREAVQDFSERVSRSAQDFIRDVKSSAEKVAGTAVQQIAATSHALVTEAKTFTAKIGENIDKTYRAAAETACALRCAALKSVGLKNSSTPCAFCDRPAEGNASLLSGLKAIPQPR